MPRRVQVRFGVRGRYDAGDMKLRWKLLGLLLGVSLGPLVAVRAFDVLAMRRMGREVAGNTRAHLAGQAERELKRIIDDDARMLNVESKLILFILREQMQEVQERLDQAPPEVSPAEVSEAEHEKIWTAEDFDGGLVPGLEESEAFAPMKVSFKTQVLRLSPAPGSTAVEGTGLTSGAVAEDIARLADMTQVYRQLRAVYPEAMLWQYTTLANGVHFAYPGKGGYPADYDPRKRAWFVETGKATGPRWFAPVADVTTGRLTLTAAATLHRPDGSFAGVTGIDVPVSAVLGQSRIEAPWARDADQAMLSLTDGAGCRAMGLKSEGDGPFAVVFARAKQGDRGGDWRLPSQYELLRCDDATSLEAVLEDMAAGRGGVSQVTVDGKQQLWAYGPLDVRQSAYLVIRVPYDRIVAGAAAMEDRILNQMWQSLSDSAWIAGLLTGVVLMATWLGARVVSRPVRQLAEAAKQVAAGNLDARVRLRQLVRDELNEMATAFNTMVPKLRDRLRLRESLALAMQVQQSLLPEIPPVVEGLDIAGASKYCDETGGDYFDFIELNELRKGRLGVAIGDVAGHGVSAALLMATARALLRSRITMPGSLAEVFGDVNRHLCEGQFSGRFMTLFYLMIDTTGRRLSWISAGHDPAMLYDPASDAFTELKGTDVPLGLDGAWQFRECEGGSWREGQVLVMGTDGIWECRDRGREMFGKVRLQEIVRANAGKAAKEIAGAITQAVQEHRGGAAQQDDITLVVIRWTPRK